VEVRQVFGNGIEDRAVLRFGERSGVVIEPGIFPDSGLRDMGGELVSVVWIVFAADTEPVVKVRKLMPNVCLDRASNQRPRCRIRIDTFLVEMSEPPRCNGFVDETGSGPVGQMEVREHYT
jgi:hypothetical protein